MTAETYFARRPALSALRFRDFRLMVFNTTLQFILFPMQGITLTFWAIDRYPDEKVLFPGLIAAARGVGMLGLGLVGGAIADRFERRHVLRFCETAATAITAYIAVLMIWHPFGEATFYFVLAGVFLFAANMGVDGPARAASIPAIVGPAEMGRALGLNNIAQQVTFPLVLPLVGYFVGMFGPDKVFAASLAVYAIILPVAYSYRFSSVKGAGERKSLGRDIIAGLRYVRSEAAISGILMLIVVLHVIGMGGIGILGPVWFTQILGLTRTQFGFAAMLWGLGAATSSFFFARMQGFTNRGMTLCVTVLGFGVAATIFGHSRFVPLTLLANAAAGFAMAGTMITAMTIIQRLVRDDMRGRVMGLMPLTMGFSMLNGATVGYVGQRVGLEVMMPSLGWLTIAIAGVVILARPAMRAVRPVPAGLTPAAAQPSESAAS